MPATAAATRAGPLHHSTGVAAVPGAAMATGAKLSKTCAWVLGCVVWDRWHGAASDAVTGCSGMLSLRLALIGMGLQWWLSAAAALRDVEQHRLLLQEEQRWPAPRLSWRSPASG